MWNLFSYEVKPYFKGINNHFLATYILLDPDGIIILTGKISKICYF